ncbi:MAG TPA: hypothetical protein VMU88_00880 [bacterium]|nr:hypothetical protein [bacterium]
MEKTKNNKKVEVWAKAAGKSQIKYDPRFPKKDYSTRVAEEEFLHDYYKSKLIKN